MTGHDPRYLYVRHLLVPVLDDYVRELRMQAGECACYGEIDYTSPASIVATVDAISRAYLASEGTWNDRAVLYVRALSFEISGLLMRESGLSYSPVPISDIRLRVFGA